MHNSFSRTVVIRALAALFLGQLPGLAQAQVPANVFSYSRVSSFTYETVAGPKKGLLLTETIEPDQSNLCVVTCATTKNCPGATGLAVFTERSSAATLMAAKACSPPPSPTSCSVSATAPSQ